MCTMISQPVSLLPTSGDDPVVQRQQQLLLKQERIKLTSDQQRLFLSQISQENIQVDDVVAGKEWAFRSDDEINNSCSPHDILRENISNLPATLKRIQHCRRSSGDGHQEMPDISAWQRKQGQKDDNHEKEDLDFSCLYPRDDESCRVRFCPTLSLYDHFEEDESSHSYFGERISNRDLKNQEAVFNDNDTFFYRRARRCWYSADELREMRNERKTTLKNLRDANFDVRYIEKFKYELRGFESYLPQGDVNEIQRKRKHAIQAVLSEQDRQQRVIGKILNSNQLGDVSRRVTKWFEFRAVEIAKQDAIDAQEIYRMDISTLHESLNESLALMDIDEFMNGSGNDSALRYWADSSWTQNLMEE